MAQTSTIATAKKVNGKDVELKAMTDVDTEPFRQQKSNINVVINVTYNEETARDTKIHFRCKIFQYILLFMVAIAYTWYGINQINAGKEHPASKFYQDTTSRYPLPTTMNCAPWKPNNKSYFNIINGKFNAFNATLCESAGCQEYIVELENISTLTNTSTQIIHGYFQMYRNMRFECFMIIPAKNISYTDIYSLKFEYWTNGYLNADSSLSSYNIPQFLVNQEMYEMYHTVFHIDDFIEQHADFHGVITSNISNYLFRNVFEFGNPIYSTLFGFDSLILTLTKKINVDGHISNAFAFTLSSHLISVDNFSIPNCTAWINDLCSIFWVEYTPLPGDAGFVVQYSQQYSNYVLTDLLSGLGGIVSGANGLILTIISFLLFGVQVGCIKYAGLAPYPAFDHNFKQRLRAFITREME